MMQDIFDTGPARERGRTQMKVVIHLQALPGAKKCSGIPGNSLKCLQNASSIS